ncbi:phosphatase 2C-like domain-containing protein [Paraphysoderma sedebokerense]|nr:phosphatase 2C-like domain-containing protein [Paraphysoderma sedebokerense]
MKFQTITLIFLISLFVYGEAGILRSSSLIKRTDDDLSPFATSQSTNDDDLNPFATSQGTNKKDLNPFANFQGFNDDDFSNPGLGFGDTEPQEPESEEEPDDDDSPRSQSSRGGFDLVGGAWCKGEIKSGVTGPGSDKIKISQDCGDDAFYVSKKRNAIFFSVADGVGDFRVKGVDPKYFSWGLMNFCQKASKSDRTPKDILAKGHSKLLNSNLLEKGGSTVALLKFERSNAELTSASIGDTLYMIVRDGKIVFKSSPMMQMIKFNTPFQLSMDPFARNQVGGAREEKHTLRDGDIVLVASDGLFDNSFDEDIIKTIRITENSSQGSMTKLAEVLGKQAVKFMSQKDRVSPHIQAYNKYKKTDKTGGKPDDITILAYKVVKSS